MREFSEDGPALLIQMAQLADEEWEDQDWLEALTTLNVLALYIVDLTWEATGYARREGWAWDVLADRLGITRQAAWERFGSAEPPLDRGITAGRQAYFEKFLVETLRVAGQPLSLQQLYGLAENKADPERIDDVLCRHTNQGRSTIFEWQHDLRWSLLKLKKKGIVRQPSKGWYEAC